MSLTTAEKNDVIRHLGWPAATIVEGSSAFNRIINQRLNGLSDEAVIDTRKLLQRIEGLDERLDKALDRLSARRVGDIELNPDELPMLRKERHRLVRELSQLVDVIHAGGSGISVGLSI